MNKIKHKILCVDDEKDILDALERLFRKNFEVLKANSGKKGLEILKEQEVSLIISDQRMPEMSGVEFLKESCLLCPEAIRILLTGYTDIDSVVGAINSGQVYRYLTKPWDSVDLKNTVEKSIETFELSQEVKLKNLELKKALKELQTLDQAKSQFMILINHELKTPLTVMTSFIELLKESHPTEDQLKYIHHIQDGNAKLSKLISDVLEIIAAEAGTLNLLKQKISCKDLFKSDYDTPFKDRLKSKDQKLNLPIEDHSFEADISVINKVLTKLINNSIEFGNRDSFISIRCNQKEDKTYFSVSNSGEDLSQEVIENILKPFTLNNNIMNHHKGTGLGLTYCQALLKTHNSQLNFQSKNGKTKVSFLI